MLIASLCPTTPKAATLCCGLHGRPSPFRYATLLSRGGHSRPHPASQGRSGGRWSAVTAGSEQLFFINNKRQKYNRKILNSFDRFSRKPTKKIKYKKSPQKYQYRHPHKANEKNKKTAAINTAPSRNFCHGFLKNHAKRQSFKRLLLLVFLSALLIQLLSFFSFFLLEILLNKKNYYNEKCK